MLQAVLDWDLFIYAVRSFQGIIVSSYMEDNIVPCSFSILSKKLGDV